MANKTNEDGIVNIRRIYEDREDEDNKVSPLLHDKIRDRVVYAPLGSGRELATTTKEFLKKFKLLPDEPTVGRNI